MNQNQLMKAIKRAGEAYSNTDNYVDILGRTPCIKLGLGHIKNTDFIMKNWNDIMNESISLPWGSILFDIRDYSVPNYLTGEREAQNMAVHVQAISVPMNEVQIPLMLLQDFREHDKVVMHKTYVLYGDQAGMHTMCSVDRMASGCNCYKQNVFSQSPEYMMKILDNTPCFKGDIGLALPDCSQYHRDCTSTIGQKREMTDLSRLILFYMNLPSNCLIRVTDTSHKKIKMSNVYYILVDKGQLERLQAGDDTAEVEGNSFDDGSKLIMELEKPFFSPEFTPFLIGHKKYEVVVDKARKSPQDSPKGNEQSGTALGNDLPENSSGDTSA